MAKMRTKLDTAFLFRAEFLMMQQINFVYKIIDAIRKLDMVETFFKILLFSY
jgi:hypothetical protein